MTMEPTGEPDKLDIKNLLISFKGRIRRQHFWIGVALMIVIGIIGSLLPTIVGVIVSLALLWPLAALFLKRGHDMGKADTFSYIPIGLAAVSTVISSIWNLTAGDAYRRALESGDLEALSAASGTNLMWISSALSLIFLIFLIWYGAADGEPRSNQWGANPKGIN